MSESNRNKSRTQFIIAIDEDDDDSDGVEDVSDKKDANEPMNANELKMDEKFMESVSETLQSVLDSIVNNNVIAIRSETDIIPKLIDAKKCDSNKSQTFTDRNPLPIDEVETVDDLEVDIFSNESNDSMDFHNELVFAEDDEEEDCMILDDFTNRLNASNERSSVDNQNADQLDDDVIFVNQTNLIQQNELKDKEIIEISDDEDDDCLIVNTSQENSKSGPFDERSSGPKRSNSPVYTSESYIPLSQPSTSRLTESSDNNPSNEWFRKSSYKNRSRRRHNSDGKQSDSSNRNLSHSSKHMPVSSTSYGKPLEVIDENDDLIPFIYDDPKPSTSNESSIESSSVIGDIDLIANCVKLDKSIVQSVVHLIEDQCTVPFIVRYRQSIIRGIDADKVRRINSVYNDLKEAKERAKEVEVILKKQNRLNPRLKKALNRCKNVFEIEHLYRLCRNDNSDSEKYANLGLSDSAIEVLGGKHLDPKHFVNRFASGLDSAEAVTEGWSAIIVGIISQDCDVLEFLISSYREHTPTLETVVDQEKIQDMIRDKSKSKSNIEVIQKYLRFSSFKKKIDKINAHCLMAIERGESIGLLNVYIEFAPTILNKLIDFCLSKWDKVLPHFLVNCIRKAFNNQLKPCLADYIRWELRHSSHLSALDVFRNNVKHLLLETPLRGQTVIGVDPGFDSGCKVAVVSAWGVPLQYKILKLDTSSNCDTAATKLKDLLISNDCSIIALGNGTGCRKFEDLLLQKMRSGFFAPIDLKYKIISESGVSWYSVTQEAKQDLPHFPPKIIGAISIARRLIDPLSELVKVDPKRLQVGMYMRDIDEKKVRKAFHEVAVECVSFCGVDVNVASFEVLSKVAGLEPGIARIIIDKRSRDGLFTSRSQLKNIDGLGWKQFEQCAGFIKIMPSTSQVPHFTRKNTGDDISNKRMATSTHDYDPLDSTIIHPESYSSANTYLELIGADKSEIGKQVIRNKIKSCYMRHSLPEIAQLCNTHAANMKLIIESLSNSIDFDYRINFQQIYVPEIQYFYELKEGSNLKGRVVNVTPMGAFIDCGIAGGINAYLNAKDCVKHNVAVNDNVMVKIISIDRQPERFKVALVKVFKNSLKFN